MFGNAVVFSFNDGFDLPSNFSEMLENSSLKPIQPMEAQTTGWVKPLDDDAYIVKVGRLIFFKLGITEKVLPAAIINEKVDKVEKERLHKFNRIMSRKEKSDLKNQIYIEMLPDALSKTQTINCCLDITKELFLVDTSSQSKAESVVSFLRQTLGSFRVCAFGKSSFAANQLTSWVKNNSVPENFHFGNQLTLKSLDDSKSVIKASNIELEASQMTEHLNDGFLVTDLRMARNQRLEFNIGHDLTMKKIKLADEALEDLNNDLEEIDPSDKGKVYLTNITLKVSEIIDSWVPMKNMLHAS